MTQRIYSSRNTFGGNVPPQQKKCPQCERYKEAAFRDAIEFDKFRTMLKIADDMLITLRAENERLRGALAGLLEVRCNCIEGEHKQVTIARAALQSKGE
jgi:hypothetical protein